MINDDGYSNLRTVRDYVAASKADSITYGTPDVTSGIQEVVGELAPCVTRSTMSTR